MFTVALDAVTTAALLFIISSGLLIVFGVMKIINFAHAAFVTVGGYAALVGAWLGLPWVLVLPLAFAAGAVCGALTEAIAVRRLYQAPIPGTIDLAGVDYSAYRIVMIAAAVIVAVVFTGLLGGTRLGLSTRAVIMNETLAQGLGINSARVRLVTFAIGSGLAALAGALIQPLSSGDPELGLPML